MTLAVPGTGDVAIAPRDRRTLRNPARGPRAGRRGRPHAQRRPGSSASPTRSDWTRWQIPSRSPRSGSLSARSTRACGSRAWAGRSRAASTTSARSRTARIRARTPSSSPRGGCSSTRRSSPVCSRRVLRAGRGRPRTTQVYEALRDGRRRVVPRRGRPLCPASHAALGWCDRHRRLGPAHGRQPDARRWLPGHRRKADDHRTKPDHASSRRCRWSSTPSSDDCRSRVDPPPAVYANPPRWQPALDRAQPRQASRAQGRAQRLRRGNRPPAGGTVMAGKVVDHWRAAA